MDTWRYFLENRTYIQYSIYWPHILPEQMILYKVDILIYYPLPIFYRDFANFIALLTGAIYGIKYLWEVRKYNRYVQL